MAERVKVGNGASPRLPTVAYQNALKSATVRAHGCPRIAPGIRTTNPIESVFATVRHRTVRTKGCLSHGTTLAMVFKLITTASKTWRRLMGNNQLPKVIEGVRFKDGMQIDETKTRAAA